MESKKIKALRRAIDAEDRRGQKEMDNPKRISSFFIPTKVRSSISDIRLEVVEDALLGYETVTLDKLIQLRSLMRKHPQDVKEFINDHINGNLRIFNRHNIPTAPVKLKEFEPLFHNVRSEEEPVYEAIKSKQGRIKELINKLQTVDGYTVEFVGGEAQDELPEYRQLFSKWGIQNDRDNTEYYALRALLTEMLVLILHISRDRDTSKRREATNVRFGHQVLSEPFTAGILDMIVGIAEGRDINKITEPARKNDNYKNRDIVADKKWLASIDRIEDLSPRAIEYINRGELKKAAHEFVAKRAQQTLESVSLLWQYAKDNDWKLPDRIEYKEIAKYSRNYSNKLRSRHYDALRDIHEGFMFAASAQTWHLVKEEANGDAVWDLIRIVSLTRVWTTKREVDRGSKISDTPIASNVKFTEEYIKAIKESNIAIIMDRISEYSSPEYKTMGLKLLNTLGRFQNKTTKNMPIKVTVSDLYKVGQLTDKNATRLRQSMTNFFNESKKLGYLSNWESSITKRKKIAYSGLAEDEKNAHEYVTVYPGEEIVRGYITPEMTEMEAKKSKIEQANRLENIKKLLEIEDEGGRRYGNFLKFVEDINEEMDSMGLDATVSSQELLEMCSGGVRITNEVSGAVDSLLEQNR